MDKLAFQKRTFAVALAIVELTSGLPRSRTADVLGRQLLRSGTSVGANYRAACRARSDREMYAKLAIVEEEADESVYWIQLMAKSGLVRREQVEPLLQELDEIIAMTVASKKTLFKRLRSSLPESATKSPLATSRMEVAETAVTAQKSTIENREW